MPASVFVLGTTDVYHKVCTVLFRTSCADFSQQDIQELAAGISCCSQLQELLWTCMFSSQLPAFPQAQRANNTYSFVTGFACMCRPGTDCVMRWMGCTVPTCTCTLHVGFDLGNGVGAAVAKAMTCCTQLTSLNLYSMFLCLIADVLTRGYVLAHLWSVAAA